jgi:multimeric flavodoxin WrbA
MRAVVILGSPRMERGNTAMILNPFIEGMEKEGAMVELVNTKKLKIRPCTCDFACWGSTPGHCHLKDDMQGLYPKLIDSNVWVFGIPYYCIMPGEMQDVLNRLVALTEPTIQPGGGAMYLTRRKELKLEHVVLVSTCYFWEIEQFDPLVAVMEKLCKILGVGAPFLLLRPHAGLLRNSPDAEKVLAAAKAAGRELVRTGAASEDTLRQVSGPLVSREDFVSMHEGA